MVNGSNTLKYWKTVKLKVHNATEIQLFTRQFKSSFIMQYSLRQVIFLQILTEQFLNNLLNIDICVYVIWIFNRIILYRYIIALFRLINYLISYESFIIKMWKKNTEFKCHSLIFYFQKRFHVLIFHILPYHKTRHIFFLNDV